MISTCKTKLICQFTDETKPPHRVTKQQIVTPLHLDALLKSNAQHRDKHLEISALGRTCCSRSMNLNNGTGSLVATNRILSLLSPFVVTSASEGGKRATRNHVDVSEATRKSKRGWHVQLELGDVFPSLSQQRQTTKPQHLTTKSTWHEKRGMSSPVSYL